MRDLATIRADSQRARESGNVAALALLLREEDEARWAQQLRIAAEMGDEVGADD